MSHPTTWATPPRAKLVQEIERECPSLGERASEFLLRDVRVAPTLMKYAEPSPYEIETRRELTAAAAELLAADCHRARASG